MGYQATAILGILTVFAPFLLLSLAIFLGGDN